MKTFNAEYAGGSSLSGGKAKVARVGRGGGGEYAGGSRKRWGNDDRPDETLCYNAGVSITHLRGLFRALNNVSSAKTPKSPRLKFESLRGNIGSDNTYWQNGPCIENQSSLVALR